MTWPKKTRPQFRVGDNRAREAALKGPIARDPAAAGRKSWAVRSDEVKARQLAAL
jgi:hypothetical protein